MRLKWGFFAVFLVALVTSSCRKTVAPNTDRNRAPETFLTAAPLDSIGGGPLNRVPYRYHVHWSGSDIDGAIAGYFVAVTETIPGAPLPAPKPRQYTFTTRSDSIIVFDVHEGRGTDREHGLYVFAVDNEGKADPTPAFTRFVARDRNLPGIIWETSRAEGTVYELSPGGGVSPLPFNRILTDNTDPGHATFLPRDTIPTGSAVYFGWRGFDKDWGGYISGYRFKLGPLESDYVVVDSTTHHVEYATGVGSATAQLPIGLNLFSLRAVDEAGGSTFPDSLRRLIVNFDPDTWWAGPDTTDPNLAAALLHDGHGAYLLSTDINGAPPAILDRWMGADRFCHLPADRKDVNTFLEKLAVGFEVHYYVRVEGDTVSRAADALYFFAGGTDKDSPYSIVYQVGNPPTDKCVVGVPGPPNGSPIGFEFRVLRDLVSGGRRTPAFSATYPSFNPIAAGFTPEVFFTEQGGVDNGFTGTAIANVRAVDGNNGKDRRLSDPRRYLDRYAAGTLSPDELALRRKIIRFEWNLNPYMRPEVAGFVPKADTLVTDPNFIAKLYMADPDSTSGQAKAPFLVRVRFRTASGDSTEWTPQEPFFIFSGDPFPFSIPTDLPPGRNEFEFELSDFPNQNGPSPLEDRRIVRVRIPFFWLTSS